MKTLDGRSVEIIDVERRAVRSYPILGMIEGKRAIWTNRGKFFADGRPDGRDLSEDTKAEILPWQIEKK